jgi:hypothetical protein
MSSDANRSTIGARLILDDVIACTGARCRHLGCERPVGGMVSRAETLAPVDSGVCPRCCRQGGSAALKSVRPVWVLGDRTPGGGERRDVRSRRRNPRVWTSRGRETDGLGTSSSRARRSRPLQVRLVRYDSAAGVAGCLSGDGDLPFVSPNVDLQLQEVYRRRGIVPGDPVDRDDPALG